MDQTPDRRMVPEAVQRIMTMLFTVIAVLLYAAILGTAMVQTVLGQEATLTDGAVKAARVLGGLVGAVVSAGFAGSWRPGSVQLNAQHPIGGHAATAWFSLRPPSRLRSKMASLARTLGFAGRRRTPVRAAPGSSDETPDQEAAPVAVGMALLYAGVYFLMGIAAFVLVLVKAEVPDVVDSSAWVWLGSVMASVYTYFGMDAQVASR